MGKTFELVALTQSLEAEAHTFLESINPWSPFSISIGTVMGQSPRQIWPAVMGMLEADAVIFSC